MVVLIRPYVQFRHAEGVIGAYFQGEFVGNAPAGYCIVPRGWYLGAPPEPRQSKTIPPRLISDQTETLWL